jgi:hypothetical protein
VDLAAAAAVPLELKAILSSMNGGRTLHTLKCFVVPYRPSDFDVFTKSLLGFSTQQDEFHVPRFGNLLVAVIFLEKSASLRFVVRMNDDLPVLAFVASQKTFARLF